MSRLEEDLPFTKNSSLQQILATDRSIRNSSHGENLGKRLPASHSGSPAKCKSDTEDALADVNRKSRPHFITVTMNANWPETTSNLLTPDKLLTTDHTYVVVCSILHLKKVWLS